jgi:KAP family P-loop domain
MRKRSRARGGSDARPALPPGSRLLIADRPINSAAEDRLERGGLVDAITRTVERAPREGFVVGLAGPWGEGKSSVLNLVAEKIDTRGTAQVIQFNPWLFAETDELLERFFGEFAAQIKLRGGGERLARALSRYGRAASPLTAIPKVGVVAALSRRLALEARRCSGPARRSTSAESSSSVRSPNWVDRSWSSSTTWTGFAPTGRSRR